MHFTEICLAGLLWYDLLICIGTYEPLYRAPQQKKYQPRITILCNCSYRRLLCLVGYLFSCNVIDYCNRLNACMNIQHHHNVQFIDEPMLNVKTIPLAGTGYGWVWKSRGWLGMGLVMGTRTMGIVTAPMHLSTGDNNSLAAGCLSTVGMLVIMLVSY